MPRTWSHTHPHIDTNGHQLYLTDHVPGQMGIVSTDPQGDGHETRLLPHEVDDLIAHLTLWRQRQHP
ncbi:hypothetical protein [Nocardia jejuensis]|uniref:hypothetical protein n=1 Tax=Nocardia jejuensis TaxID=328049 RepID=UPI00083748AF|nr:hypothetical protein [Nocardia jejuensis]